MTGEPGDRRSRRAWCAHERRQLPTSLSDLRAWATTTCTNTNLSDSRACVNGSDSRPCVQRLPGHLYVDLSPGRANKTLAACEAKWDADYRAWCAKWRAEHPDELPTEPDAAPVRQRKPKVIPSPDTITPTTPLRLSDAARLAFPDGSVTVNTLRTAARRGLLQIETVGNKQFTTLKAIEEMRRKS